MRKLLIAVCFIFLAACGSNQGNENLEPGNSFHAITGEITQIDGNRFLVESTENDSSQGVDKIWFSTDDIESLEVGLKVSVWTSVIRESYPAQAVAEKIEIIE